MSGDTVGSDDDVSFRIVTRYAPGTDILVTGLYINTGTEEFFARLSWVPMTTGYLQVPKDCVGGWSVSTHRTELTAALRGLADKLDGLA